jgi:hypothetical protein
VALGARERCSYFLFLSLRSPFSASTVCFGGSTGRAFGCRDEAQFFRGDPAEPASAGF